MALLLLLPLGLGLSLASAQELNLQSVVRGNYDLAKVSGVWYSISMASDDRKRIAEDGDLRVFIQKIQSVADGGLQFFFHFMLHGDCVEVAMVCEKTEKDGECTLAYAGDNRVRLWETDYMLYATFHLHSVRNGTQTRVLALYGRIPELPHSFLHRFERLCRKQGLGPQNIVSLSTRDPCVKYRR
ncbi:epididymal-specific lipocalin-9 [Myotis daubentonii]|uniref:epididymal-specific lipocalin-9 n=1 Tax=Myotis daubentonii TaxID=98922 RepID=UPI002872B867|nr:epididymal-specific lipocalin-9 [Myotis daubentonii]